MTLKEYLDRIGCRPYLFAKDAGVSKNSLYKIINGQAVSYDTAEQVSKATGRKIKTKEIYEIGRCEP